MLQLDYIEQNFGLNLKQVEQSVFEVVNKENITNLDALKRYLKKCILIISNKHQYHKNIRTGINDIVSSVYYIILDYDNNDLMIKYKKMAKNNIDKDSLIDSYNERPNIASSVDTLYTGKEIGKK